MVCSCFHCWLTVTQQHQLFGLCVVTELSSSHTWTKPPHPNPMAIGVSTAPTPSPALQSNAIKAGARLPGISTHSIRADTNHARSACK